MNLGIMMDKITSYDKVMKRHGYTSSGSGTKPWSIRHSHADGSTIDTRNSEWTYYDEHGDEKSTGRTTESLDLFLSGF